MSAKVELTPILPDKELFSITRVERELKGAIRHTANIIRDDFKATIKTWKTKPAFKKIGPRTVANNVLAVDIFTENEIYFFVTRGTRRHIIRPRNARSLAFQTGYTAKTRPRVIGSRGGGPRGPFVRARQVVHPGTTARDFDKEIARRRQRNLTNLTRLAFNRSFRFGGLR